MRSLKLVYLSFLSCICFTYGQNESLNEKLIRRKNNVENKQARLSKSYDKSLTFLGSRSNFNDKYVLLVAQIRQKIVNIV